MQPVVIFDLDGVLVDSLGAHLGPWKAVAAVEALPFDAAQFVVVFGRTSREAISFLWLERRYTNGDVVVLDDRRKAAYRDIINARFPVMPGARELIVSLSHDGFALALGSAGPRENAGFVLDKLGVRQLFGAVVTGQDVRRGKPDPEVFLTAAVRLGIAPSHGALIEDAPAGMFSIGLASTGRTHQALAHARLVGGLLQELSPALIQQLIASPPKHSY